MVSSQVAIQSHRLRAFVPVLGLIALIAMFFNLPEVSTTVCKTCFEKDPYFPLLATGYFGFLTALALLFPAFPKRELALGGLMGSITLFLLLTYIKWCPACLVGHLCHISMWAIWLVSPSLSTDASNRELRWTLLLLAPITVVALFSSLNLTLMAYDFKPPLEIGQLKKGEAVPVFTAQTSAGRTLDQTQNLMLNFVAPDCPFCKEQQQLIEEIKDRIVPISPAYLPASEWVEDRGSQLRKLFKVRGYPTLVVIENGKIVRLIEGVSEELKELK